jgi:hypothetical protein
MRNQHQILRFLTPRSKSVEKNYFSSHTVLELFANFEAERTQNGFKKMNIFFQT